LVIFMGEGLLRVADSGCIGMQGFHPASRVTPHSVARVVRQCSWP
jgi:hypothetical protein